ncbi:hypothetical protein ACFLT1_05010 [Bacteroidota bacterium]
MRKLILIFLFLAAIPLTGQADAIDLKLKVPSTVIAGTEFEVTLLIIKGDLSDFSRFAQELPLGFEAKHIESPNGHFVFNENRIRVMWLKLPENDTVTLKYSITPDERLKGTLELAGTFGYISNGERAFVDLAEIQKVDILPNPNIDASLIVDIADFGKEPDAVTEQQPADVVSRPAYATVVRQRPFVDQTGTVNISLLVRNPDGSNFLKIEEYIPAGYTFEAVESHDAVVSPGSSLARYVWMTPPEEGVFLVKYKLVPIPGETQESIMIEGNLSYTEEGKTKVVSIRELEVNVDAMNTEQRLAFMESGRIPSGLPELPDNMVLADNTSPDTQTTSEGSETTGETDTSDTSGTTANSDQNDADESTPTGASETETDASTTHSDRTNNIKEPESVTSNTWPDPNYEIPSDPFILGIQDLKFEKGVYFRVQVAAVRRPYFAKAYFAEYVLLRDVKVERLDGWSKYTVGSCASYEEAVSLRDRIIRETPEREAFIIGYKDNSRVGLSEVIVQ